MATMLNVELTLDQLLAAIRKLDAPARNRVAQVLAEAHLNSNFDQLIRELAETPAADDVSDAKINEEIKRYRQNRG